MTVHYFKKGFKTGSITGLLVAILALSYVYCVSKKNIQKSEEISKYETFQRLNLKLTDLNGKEFDINSINNKKIIVNFWATWCSPCLQEMPLLDRVYNINKDKYLFVMISDDSIEIIKKFKERKGYSFLFLKSTDKITDKIGVLPTTLFLNEEKKIIFSQQGSFEGMNSKQFEEFISSKYE